MNLYIIHLLTVCCCIVTAPVTAQVNEHGLDALSTECQAPTDLEIFCKITAGEIEKIIGDSIRKALQEVVGSEEIDDAGVDNLQITITHEFEALGLGDDIKNYFTTYWNNLKLIFTGHFDEGIFNQLKNAGSWCESDNVLVKAAKTAINAISGGSLSAICDCLYPLIKDYNTFSDLASSSSENLEKVMGKCSQKFKDIVMKALKKS